MEKVKREIPKQLQKEGFGFVKLKSGSKIPFEKKWQIKPYPYSEIKSWFDQGENYGVLGGHAGCIIIDADTPEITELVENNLPKTFTVKSPGKTGKGAHYYYFCKDILKKVVLMKDKVHYGEIISFGSQVVGAGSIHPDTGTQYQVSVDIEIAEATREQIFTVLMEYITIELPQKDSEYETDDISIVDVLNKKSIQTKSISGQLVCSHPVHDSTNGNNFTVSPEKNVWHCFRCGTGGGALSLIAVLEGIIQCAEAVKGGLRGKRFKDTLRLAKEKYGFEIKPSASKVIDLLPDEKIAILTTKVREIPAETDKVNLPGLLDHILKEIVELNIALGDAFLRHTIKSHFNLTNDDIDSYEKVLKQYRKEPKDDDKQKDLGKAELIQKLHASQGIQSVHPAQDYTGDVMVFAVKAQDTPCLITSDKKLFTLKNASSEGFYLKQGTVDTARFSAKGATSFINGDYQINAFDIYQKVRAYIERFIVFPDEMYLVYLTLWLMGTYVFMLFRYYPYAWLHAEKQSGKTLLMEILSAIAFNGSGLITNPTESVIFRDISNNLPTMFIDEVERLRKGDANAYGMMVSILNSGFSKSGTVKRTESNGQNFSVKEYSTYSPKMFAGINEIDDVLQDRTVRIPLLRKKEGETVQRYKETTDILELQQSIRDDLYVFALTYAKDIAQLYNKEGSIKGLDHLDNRELDIWEPIVLLANMVDAKSGDTQLTDTMKKLSEDSIDQKQQDSVSQNDTYKALTVLKAMIDENAVKPLPDSSEDVQIFLQEEVFGYFKKSDHFEWIEKPNVLTVRLKKINISSHQRRYEGKKVRVYLMLPKKFTDLCERFNIK